LTSSGLDPSELFDDLEDHVSHPMGNDRIGHWDNKNDPYHIPHIESDHSLNVNSGTKLEEVSLYTTPSLYSLISVHDDIDNIRGIKKGVSIDTVTIAYLFFVYIIRIC